jgi:arylsulfatase A-like enzyme
MPYNPSRKYVERFASLIIHKKAARRYIRHFNSDVFGWLAPLTNDLDDEKKAALDGMYNAEVASQDEQVGIFFERLRRSGRLDRTLLIVCADHGEHLGEKQLVGHNISLYNQLVHVPLLLRDPDGNLPRGTIAEQIVSLRRIFHTVLTAAGIANNSEEALSLARNASTDAEKGVVFAEGVTAQNALRLLQRRRPALVTEKALDQPRMAIWKDQYKLIQVGEDHLELYNIFDDQDEHINLVSSEPEVASSLQSLLRSFVDHTGPSISEVMNDEYDDDPEIYLRLRDLGYVE